MIIKFRGGKRVYTMATGKTTLPALGMYYLATTGEVVTPILTGKFRKNIKTAKNGKQYAFFDAEKAEPPVSGVLHQPTVFRMSIEDLIDSGYGYLITDSGLKTVK